MAAFGGQASKHDFGTRMGDKKAMVGYAIQGLWVYIREGKKQKTRRIESNDDKNNKHSREGRTPAFRRTKTNHKKTHHLMNISTGIGFLLNPALSQLPLSLLELPLLPFVLVLVLLVLLLRPHIPPPPPAVAVDRLESVDTLLPSLPSLPNSLFVGDGVSGSR